MMSSLKTILVALMVLITLASCAVHAEQAGDTEPTHGLVGLRPIPADDAGTQHNHGGSWEGMPTFAQQKGNYPFVADEIDILFSWVPDGDFKTKRVFFEYYWGLSKERDDLDPNKNNLIKTIRQWEAKDGVVEHILICREARLAVNRGWPEAELGPFKKDGRILSEKDVAQIRELFRKAHQLKLTQHDNYKLIQMVEEPSFFATDPKAQALIKQMDGVAYEAHQFNRHWPLETGWSKPGPVIEGAKWTLKQDMEYIFYFGPVLWKPSKHYYAFIERDWLSKFWEAGLPKQHPKMHYYLNTFPHHTGRGRPVGPETDPHSVLGFTKWLIQEIRADKERPPKPDSD